MEDFKNKYRQVVYHSTTPICLWIIAGFCKRFVHISLELRLAADWKQSQHSWFLCLGSHLVPLSGLCFCSSVFCRTDPCPVIRSNPWQNALSWRGAAFHKWVEESCHYHSIARGCTCFLQPQCRNSDLPLILVPFAVGGCPPVLTSALQSPHGPPETSIQPLRNI